MKPITNQAPLPARDDSRTAHMDARERLLARLPVTERQLSLNGVATAVLEGGDGPPVVLLHGPSGYGAQWLRAIPSLVATHRIVAPDLPGHGASEAFDGSPDAHRMNGWLDDLIECTCGTRPVLVGQTLGGAVAARFAADHPERLAGLVLVDTLGLTAFRPAPEFAFALNEFLASPTERTHDYLWSLCAFDLPTLRRRLGEQWTWIKAYNLERAQTPGLLAAQGKLMEELGSPAIPPSTLERIPVPTTLIWGRHDLATPLSVAQEASVRFGWPLCVIDDAADDPAFEQPEVFVNSLRRALERSEGEHHV